MYNTCKMSCFDRILKGVPCNGGNTKGGIDKCLIGEWFKDHPLYDNPDSGEIDRIWEDNDTESGEWDNRFVKYAIRPGSSSFTEDLVLGEDGTEYCTQTITLKLHGHDADKRLAYDSLKGKKLMAALHTRDGWQMFGVEDALRMASANGASGTGSGDFNGTVITLTCTTDRLSGLASYAFARYLDEAWREQS